MPVPLNTQLIVILNDNDMSIAEPVGALSAYLAKLATSKSHQQVRAILQNVSAAKFGDRVDRTIKRAVEYARGFVTGGTMFEELGLLSHWPH